VTPPPLEQPRPADPAQPRPTEPGPAATAEACPRCGAGLAPNQDWCLRCGTAARTRLAQTPNWRAPLAIGLLLVAISLAVLTAALVKLAG
jgi:hypothetical protein